MRDGAITATSGWQKFRLEEIPAEPWRNGSGITRTIAADVVGGDFIWRVSAADIAQSGPFSVFPGIDRAAVVIRGQGLSLCGEALQVALRQTGDLAEFPGDAPMRASLDSGPVSLWNVMTRRKAARCVLELRTNQAVEVDGAPHICLVLNGAFALVVAGRVACELQAGEGIIVRTAMPDLQLLPTGSQDTLISTRIELAMSPVPASPISVRH